MFLSLWQQCHTGGLMRGMQVSHGPQSARICHFPPHYYAASTRALSKMWKPHCQPKFWPRPRSLPHNILATASTFLHWLWGEKSGLGLQAKKLVSVSSVWCHLTSLVNGYRRRNVASIIDREFEFYEFFSFLKFNEFYEYFFGWKNLHKIHNFANHRCLTCFDVLECNVHL